MNVIRTALTGLRKHYGASEKLMKDLKNQIIGEDVLEWLTSIISGASCTSAILTRIRIAIRAASPC